MYLLRKFCFCNCIYYDFFKVIVVVSIIRTKCVILIVSIIHCVSIVSCSVYIYIYISLCIYFILLPQ